MLHLDRMCYWVFLLCLVGMIPSISLVTFIDELACLFMGVIMALDCVFNGNYKRYKGVFLIIAILAGYALYSLPLGYNTAPYIAEDFIIQLKPFIPFYVIFAIKPQFTANEKAIARAVCIVNVLIGLFLFSFFRWTLYDSIMSHPMEVGITAIVCGYVYLTFSIKPDGTVSKGTIATIVLILTCGLLSTRAKYYGEFVLTLSMLFFYRYGITKHLKLSHVIFIAAIAAIFIAVSWNKFHYYFIEGTVDVGADNPEDFAMNFARPMLYATFGMILVDHTLLGTGLASFATYASQHNYSNLYFEYSLDKIWGLSPSFPNFICDAFFPELAQFGVVGIVFFIVFWRWLYKRVRVLIRTNHIKYRYHFVIASLIIAFVLIESIANTAFVKMSGMIMMMLLGMICGKGQTVMRQLKDGKIAQTSIFT